MLNLLKDSLDKLSLKYDDEKLFKLTDFYELLIEKNKVMNLTAITEPKEFVIKHFIDSLTVLKFIRTENGMRAVDLGTGAGFPGVPLAIFLPGLEFVLIDSVNKKLKFIDEAADMLEISNIKTLHGRAEDISHMDEHREKYDYVFSRAVSSMPTLVELSLGMIKHDGFFVAYKSDNVASEIKEASKAIKLMGGEVSSEESMALPNSDIIRKLYFIKKAGVTPKKYPRKAGEPAKKPIL